MIERHFGKVTSEQLDEGGTRSKRVAKEKFPEIVWEHSHAIENAEGVVSFCIYQAPSEDYVRAHSAAAGLPCDRILEIANTVGPDDFPD